MSKEILLNEEDKETLRRKLEQLKDEYEKTAQRLQQVEHHDARQRVSDLSRNTQTNSSQASESSSVIPGFSEYPKNLQLSTYRNISEVCTQDKIPAVELQFPDISSTLPPCSPEAKRSPAHRLRSRRSRLRLLNKEKEADFSQENFSQRETGSEHFHMETSVKKIRHKDKECTMRKDQDAVKEKGKDRPVSVKKSPNDKRERLCVINVSDRVVSCQENNKTIQNDGKLPEEVDNVNQMRKKKVSISIKDSFLPQTVLSVKAEEMGKQTNHSLTDLNNDCDERIEGKPSSLVSGILDSCTLVEGLPFPVEYYVRTTRRMAASQSSIDLDAVIYSQLSRGRGRRRFSQSKMRTKVGVTPEHPVGGSIERSRGRGRRGRRGQQSSSVVRGSGCKAALDRTVHNQTDSHESVTQSQRDTELVPIVKETQGAEQRLFQHLKELPDSQLYIDSQLPLDSGLYPIFRRTLVRTRRELRTNKNDLSPLLPSLASLVQALQEKETNSTLLTPVGIQDFHLPDEDFGLLKLERLCLSSSKVELLTPHPLVYRKNQRGRRQRESGGTSKPDTRSSLDETFTPEATTIHSLEDSLSLCQPNFADQSKVQVNEQKNIATSSIDSQCLVVKAQSQEEPSKPQMITNILSHFKENCSSEKQSHSPMVLNLSSSLTSPTQKPQDPVLPSLGVSPHFLSSRSPLNLCSPLFSSSGIHISPSSITLSECTSLDSGSTGNIRNRVSRKHIDTTEIQVCPYIKRSQEGISQALKNEKPGTSPPNKTSNSTPETLKRGSQCTSQVDHENCLETSNSLEDGNKVKSTREMEKQLQNNSAAELECQTRNNSEIEVQSCLHKSERNLVPGLECKTVVQERSSDLSTNQETQRRTQPEDFSIRIQAAVLDGSLTAAALSPGILEEMHTFKALEGGYVLDLCLLRWPSEDWCICVAGEWSVCLWAQTMGFQKWSLTHSWTFTQSVVSLQAIPNSSGLLSVTLGHLEITEARVLCCPSVDGPFSQSVVSKERLLAVLGVSNCRLVFCSTPGDQQRVNIITLGLDGSVETSRPCVSVKQNICTIAAVEGEEDALIGWTECKALLIWNMKSGQLLKSIFLEKTLSVTNCMKGFSYNGMLCVLSQNSGNGCETDSDSALFTLTATNPVTGKHITLTSINNPNPHKQQLIDADVLGSRLVCVLQSGFLCVWDLRESLTKATVLDDLCRVARWGRDDTLLTGHLNGDVSVFHYKSA